MAIYSYAISDQAVDLICTGTISVTGTAVTGSLTAFLSEVAAGYVIHAAGYDLVVYSVTNNTTLTLVTAPPANFSGATFSITALSNVETLGLNAPRSTFKPWVSTIDLGNATARALGRPLAAWLWGFVTQAQRNTLRAYCTGKSARVYICTRKNDTSDAYVTYDALMLWPDDEEKATGRRLNFTLQFRDLIAL